MDWGADHLLAARGVIDSAIGDGLGGSARLDENGVYVQGGVAPWGEGLEDDYSEESFA